MHDVIPLWFMPLYGFMWAGVARLAVEIWRVNQRGRRERTSRQMLSRLCRFL
jgi:hypothetical protein